MESYLESAQEVFDRSASTRPQHRAEYLLLAGELAALLGDARRAVETEREGLLFCVSHGFLRFAAFMAHSLSVNHFNGGQRRAAYEHARNALVLSNSLHDDYVSGGILALLAFHEICGGRPAEGLALATKARSLFREADVGAVSCDVTIALALQSTGRLHDALAVLETLRRETMQRGLYRFSGTAESLCAQTYYELDRHRDAMNANDNAVQLLEHYGSLDSLGRAYERSAHITGNTIHRTRAKEIRAQLAL